MDKAMDWTQLRSALVLIIAGLLAFSVACGDDEIDASDGGEVDSQNQNQGQDDENQDQDEDDECEDNQTYNPITGECVDGGEENQEPENQEGACADVECDDGMHCDPSSGECVECIGDGHCDSGLACDPAQNECVEEDQIPEGCSSDEDCPDDQVCNPDSEQCEDEAGEFECGPGVIVGETCTPDDEVLPHADVTVEGYNCDGEFFKMETEADGDGYYEFEDVPAGNHELTIASGSFEVTDEVSVQKNEETDLASVGAKLCFTGTEVNIAVATGFYDDIEAVLSGMNIEYDTISDNSSFFSDLDQMQQYDISKRSVG